MPESHALKQPNVQFTPLLAFSVRERSDTGRLTQGGGGSQQRPHPPLATLAAGGTEGELVHIQSCSAFLWNTHSGSKS